MKKVWCLNELELFKELDSGKRTEIESLFDIKNYRKGEFIAQPGDNEKVFIVKSGKLELYQLSPDGRKFIVEVLKKGSAFGDLALKTSGETYIEALGASEICSLDKTKFFSIVSKEPTLAEKFLKHLFVKLLNTEKKAASLAIDNVLTRLAKLLLSLGREDSTKKDILVTDAFTHEQIAQMLGISRQTVTTLLNSLERDGTIKRKKKHFVFDPKKLNAIAK